MENIKNYGVIMGQEYNTTYVGGTIPYEVRNESGDWTPYLVKGEIQYSPKDDWMDCVSRSLTNTVEIQEKHQTGQEVDYSERRLAKMSGTTRQGNLLDKVAETARTTGLVLESSYPDTDGDWSEQYAEIVEPLRSKLDEEGGDWLNKWDIKYEVIPYDRKSLRYHLKHAPLQVVVPGHAIVGINSNGDVDKIFDSYVPYVKNVPGDYSGIIYAMKIVLYKKTEAIDPDALLVDIKYGEMGPKVLKLKRVLKRLGWFTDEGDFYETKLKQVVFNFQLANLERTKWAFWFHKFFYKGEWVDSETREVINKALSRKI